MVGRRPPGWAELGSPRARCLLALLISLSIGGEWLCASLLHPARADDETRAGPRYVVNAWSISRAALRGGEWFQRRFVGRNVLPREREPSRDPVDTALDDALRASRSIQRESCAPSPRR